MEIRSSIVNTHYFMIMSFYNNLDEYIGKIIYNENNYDSIVDLIYIFVVEKFRTKNLSKHIYILFEEMVKKRGNNIIKLTAKEHVEKFGKLKKLYQSWGFVINGKERIHYEGDFCFTKIPMSKNLNKNT